MRVGLLGCGDIAPAHLNALEVVDGLTATKVYDSNSELSRRTASEHGIQAAPDIDAFYRDLDAVSIALPHDLHLPSVRVAIERGVRAILLEKPIAQTLTDAQQIVALCAGAGVQLAVWHVARYDPEVRAARQFVMSGGLGRPVMTAINLHRNKPDSYWLGRDGQPSWRASYVRSGGGILMMNVIHSLDAMRYILGDDVVTAAASTRHGSGPAEVETVASGTLEWGSGALGVIAASSVAPAWVREPDRIIGTHGEVRYGRNLGAHAFTVCDNDLLPPGQWHQLELNDAVEPRGEDREAHVARVQLLTEFRDWVTNGAVPPPPQGQDALRSLAAIDALYRSAASGRREEVIV